MLPHPTARKGRKIEVGRWHLICTLGARCDEPAIQHRIREGEPQRLALARLAKSCGRDPAVVPDLDRCERPAPHVPPDLVLRAPEHEGPASQRSTWPRAGCVVPTGP